MLLVFRSEGLLVGVLQWGFVKICVNKGFTLHFLCFSGGVQQYEVGSRNPVKRRKPHLSSLDLCSTMMNLAHEGYNCSISEPLTSARCFAFHCVCFQEQGPCSNTSFRSLGDIAPSSGFSCLNTWSITYWLSLLHSSLHLSLDLAVLFHSTLICSKILPFETSILSFLPLSMSKFNPSKCPDKSEQMDVHLDD